MDLFACCSWMNVIIRTPTNKNENKKLLISRTLETQARSVARNRHSKSSFFPLRFRRAFFLPCAFQVLALCLSSRRNLCIHERVIEESDREAVDGACRDMTASWVRKKAEAG